MFCKLILGDAILSALLQQRVQQLRIIPVIPILDSLQWKAPNKGVVS